MVRLSAVLAALMLCACSASAETQPTPSIVLTGEAKVGMAPELAYLSLGVHSEKENAYEALAANNMAMEALFKTLSDNKVEKKDIQTTGFNISPKYRYSKEQEPPTLVGYTVANTVTVTVRDLPGLGGLLDGLVKSGANRVHGITWGVCDPGKMADECRTKAIQDARRKASIYAEGGDFKLGAVLSVMEQSASRSMSQMYAASASELSERASSVPISAGEVSLSVRISVTFAIEKK